jgi:hypothetical protein
MFIKKECLKGRKEGSRIKEVERQEKGYRGEGR